MSRRQRAFRKRRPANVCQRCRKRLLIYDLAAINRRKGKPAVFVFVKFHGGHFCNGERAEA